MFISCKKDNKDTGPVLPASESMTMDFSNFQVPAQKSLFADDITKYNNWTSSAVTVAVWSTIVYLNSAIPVAAFRESFNHPAVFEGNATWRREFSLTYNGAAITCKLDGTVNTNNVDWKMYVSKTGGQGSDFTDFIWFTGTSSIDGTTASWHIKRGPEFNDRQYFEVDWVKDLSLRYTLADPTDPGVGNYLEYDKIDEAGLDSQFLVQTVNHSNDITIQWNRLNKNGRVKCPNWYGDLIWHCWGNDYKNTICN
jgi:hypothetical protein